MITAEIRTVNLVVIAVDDLLEVGGWVPRRAGDQEQDSFDRNGDLRMPLSKKRLLRHPPIQPHIAAERTG